jgi:hypothetical protein
MPSDSQTFAPLNEVARRCREETEHFFRRLAHDTQYCFELFRRALALHNGDALALLMQNYRGLVEAWVRHHPKFEQTNEDAEAFAIAAFERMWIAVTPARFARFPELRSLLKYLQMCAHCSIADYLRTVDPTKPIDPDGPGDPGRELAAPETFLSQPERAEMWEEVLAEMRTEKERVVLQCCFGLEMKPGDVHEEFPGIFASVQEVYRTKQNIMERLRRNEALRKSLSQYR